MIEKLPIEIAASVLNYFNTTELINISNMNLPKNFDFAIRDGSVWKKKMIHVKNLVDMKRCMKNIAKVQNCTRVSFACSQINQRDMLKVVRSIKSIEYLTFEGFIDLDDDILEEIVQIHGKDLKYLNVSGCQYLTNFTLTQIIRYCTKMSTLILSGCSFSPAGLEILTESDKLIDSLRVLDISRCYLMDQGAILPLSKLVKLVKLSLCNLEWVNSSNLPFIIGTIPTIQCVDIRNCDDFTQMSVKSVQDSIDHPIKIIENTKLLDESPESIRSYLMAIINSRIEN